ncbi:MAG: hypothetical protein HKN09_09990 [Saprospiraceae bacterium]|nr:hypothetical protein [Saprospiraceae bacterium]
MKKRFKNFCLVFIVLVSVCSYLYLNQCTSVQKKNAVVELQELNNSTDRMIASITYMTIVVEKVVDIITTRQA